MKKIFKKYLPIFLKENIKKHINNQLIVNYYKTMYDKRALVSYITVPLRKNSLEHTNYFEVQSWVKILSEFGYNVDVIHYENSKNIDLSSYDLICGFGDVFRQYFENSKKNNTKTIYYATGMHVCHQNQVSLQRVKDVYLEKKVWLGKSARFVEKTWTHQTALVDGIIALGNEICANSYKQYYDGAVLSVEAPFYKTQNANEIMKNRNQNSQKHFLWFGSAGLIHKGLDLLLDYFSKNVDVTLHICGHIQNELDFCRVYKKELYEMPNIITYGFVDIKSELFADILKSCSFVIFPSCSEGGAASVLTAIGNGALIPIITKETTISTGYEIWIDDFNYIGIDKAVKQALELNDYQISELQKKNHENVQANHSQQNYFNQLKLSVSKILENKDEL